MFTSIRLKLIVTYLVLILTSLFITGGFLEYSLRDYNRESLKQEMIKQASVISELVVEELQAGGPAELNPLASSLDKNIGARVTIIDKNGYVLADSRSSYLTMENHLERPEIQQALHKGLGTDVRHSATMDDNLLYVAKPIFVDGTVLGIIRLAVPLAQARLVPFAVTKLLLAGTILAALAAILLSISFAQSLTEPLQEIARVARRITAGDFSLKIYPRSHDEIGQLGAIINEMANTIREKVAELSFAKDRLETVLNYMVSGVLLLNAKGEILLANPAAEAIFAIKAKEATGKHNLEVLRNYHLNEKMQEALKTEEVVTADLQTIFPEERFLRAYFAPLPGESRAKGVLIVLHDITAMRRLEQMRTEFVANASHELRTPLTAIKGFAETLLDGALQDPVASKRFVSIIDQEAERLNRLVEDLLDLARIESKKVKMVMQPVELNSLVSQIALELNHRLDKGDLKLEIIVPKDLPKVKGDRDWLYQVFLNLIDNSIKYTPPGGKILVSAVPKEKEIRVEVQDSGIGIPKEDLPRIFERFYRVDKARSRQLGGTGLGLSIVKHVIENHGGKIGIKSKLGEGTTVWFTLPKA